MLKELFDNNELSINLSKAKTFSFFGSKKINTGIKIEINVREIEKKRVCKYILGVIMDERLYSRVK